MESRDGHISRRIGQQNHDPSTCPPGAQGGQTQPHKNHTDSAVEASVLGLQVLAVVPAERETSPAQRDKGQAKQLLLPDLILTSTHLSTFLSWTFGTVLNLCFLK